MTTLQALQSKVGINYPGLTDSALVYLIDSNIDPTAVYDSSYTKAIDLATAGLILTLCTGPDIKEGGYQVTQADRTAMMAVRSLILSKYGISDGSATITNASNVW
jgi:type VI protein secretion system component Hcp